MIRRAFLTAIACSALTGCGASGPSVATGASAPAAQAEPGEILADALAAADGALRDGDRAALARSLARIDGLGARPLDDAAKSELARWRQAAPDMGPPVRGRALGPGYLSGYVDPGGDTRTEQIFLSGQRAVVALSSPDGATLGLRIVDPGTGTVCSEQALKSRCKWTPVFTRRHQITVSNGGRARAKFYLVLD